MYGIRYFIQIVDFCYSWGGGGVTGVTVLMKSFTFHSVTLTPTLTPTPTYILQILGLHSTFEDYHNHSLKLFKKLGDKGYQKDHRADSDNRPIRLKTTAPPTTKW